MLIIFQLQAKIFLLLHLTFAAYLLGGISHLLNYILKIKKNNLNDTEKTNQILIYKKIMVGYLGAFITGLIIYPPFRYYVRFFYLDKNFPLGSFLFEIKEHLAALGLVIIGMQYFLLNKLYLNDFIYNRKLFLVLNLVLILFISYIFIVGSYLVMIKSI